MKSAFCCVTSAWKIWKKHEGLDWICTGSLAIMSISALSYLCCQVCIMACIILMLKSCSHLFYLPLQCLCSWILDTLAFNHDMLNFFFMFLGVRFLKVLKIGAAFTVSTQTWNHASFPNAVSFSAARLISWIFRVTAVVSFALKFLVVTLVQFL